MSGRPLPPSRSNGETDGTRRYLDDRAVGPPKGPAGGDRECEPLECKCTRRDPRAADNQARSVSSTGIPQQSESRQLREMRIDIGHTQRASKEEDRPRQARSDGGNRTRTKEVDGNVTASTVRLYACQKIAINATIESGIVSR